MYCFTLFTVLGAWAFDDATVKHFRFSKEDAGSMPAGWKAEHTGKGEGSIWKVEADALAPGKTGYALAQCAESPSAYFNICVVEGTSYQDLKLQVSFKALRGHNDQGGGVVWRYQDANNYYIARMNPLEDNFRVYKVVGGKRIQLESKEGIKIPEGTWRVIAIEHEGDHIQCFLDGVKSLDVHDRVFPNAGKIGLWTKSDAQTLFDGFTVIAK